MNYKSNELPQANELTPDHRRRKTRPDVIGIAWCTFAFLIPFNTVVESRTVHLALQGMLLLSAAIIVRAVFTIRRLPVAVVATAIGIVLIPLFLSIRSPYIIVLIFFAGAGLGVSSNRWPSQLRWFMMGSAIMCLIEYGLKKPGLWESLLGLTHIFYNGYELRARGTLGHPLTTGTVLGAYLLGDLFTRRTSGRPWRGKRLLLNILIFSAILTTAAFTPFIAAVVAVAVVRVRGNLSVRLRKRFLVVTGFVISLVFVLLAVFLLSPFSGPGSNSISNFKAEVDGRVEHAKIGNDELTLNPCEDLSCVLSGHGYRDLQTELIANQLLGGLSSVDNQFATTLYDEGWMGMAAILALIYFVVKRRDPAMRGLSTPIVVVAIALLASFFSFDVLYNYGTDALLGIYVGALYRIDLSS